MRLVFYALTVLTSGLMPLQTNAQSDFSVQHYRQFLQDNRNLPTATLAERHAPAAPYYSQRQAGLSLRGVSYLDSIALRYQLTDDEQALLRNNYFVVSERMSFNSFSAAFHNVYGKDMPVFISTDAILHTVHFSYDLMLKDLELAFLRPKLAEVLNGLYNTFPQLETKYRSEAKMQDPLDDVDLYITIGKSLLETNKLSAHRVSAVQVAQLLNAIQAEQLVSMPLFTKANRSRRLDFSQFIPRGHYTDVDFGAKLVPYFKAMTWLGRIDFFLTPPPVVDPEPPWEREEIRRMNLAALLLNELVDMAQVQPLLDEMDDLITFMVGDSDNMTPNELKDLVQTQGLERADDLLDDSSFDAFLAELATTPEYGQKILSSFFLADPSSAEPEPLPVSFRLFGQRFIIDSYIFFNVVFDRILYEDQKILRLMPNPLDAMFALGNDDALPLLKEELEEYKYASQLASLRYLVDAYDEDFWEQSFYNIWLQAIRLLNRPEDGLAVPYFMQTTAWQQQKLNTQLAAWSQLRHDNLLYAKQSYSFGVPVCSFPFSFVEPYPAFYRQLRLFAEKGEAILLPKIQQLSSDEWETDMAKWHIQDYFPRFKELMSKLEVIAQKELDAQPLDAEEEAFLRRMLFASGGGSGPAFTGWYIDLFYGYQDAPGEDYVVADVHTQPTDEFGNIVGRVLHGGVGKINLGVFIADRPAEDCQPMAYIGPVISYYEKITENFDRLTDERWTSMVQADELPPRPDWVNIYLADRNGRAFQPGRELPGVPYEQGFAQLASDFNDDGNVDFDDFYLFADAFGGKDPHFDLDGSGSVDFEDLFIFAENFAGETRAKVLALAQAHLDLPAALSLEASFPNPFNSDTVIRFRLPTSGHVQLTVYNLSGQKVATLVNAPHQAGTHTLRWDGRSAEGQHLASGIYLYRLQAGNQVKTRKLALVR